MRLSSLFIPENQLHTEGNGREISSAMEQNLKNGMEEVASKTPGQSITGEVIEKNGNEILLAIGKNQILRARLDSSVLIEAGQQMTFTIKNAGGSRVTLSPLFANTGNDPNISKALQMAGIFENERSAQMVRAMMQEGMSIDRDSLLQMMRTVNLNPDANVETIVQLSRLGIPVTENNIFQMEAYKNYEHQITEGLLEIADTLGDTVSEMIMTGDVQGSIDLYKEIFSLLEEPFMDEKGGTGQTVAVPLETEIQDAGKNMSEQEAILEEEGQAETPHERNGLTEKEILTLNDKFLQAGLSDGMAKAFMSGKLSTGALFGGLKELLFKNDLPKEQRNGIAELISSRELNKLVKNEMKEQWLVAPEDVAKSDKVERLYERLNSQMNRLNQALEQAAKADTPLGRAVSNLSGNIDFMNQLNQMFTYVQLPLKLQDQEANGELYVYTNKKNLSKKDGEVSALLHLDMEHLGSVDVHVAMKDNNVSTKFYLKDDSILDFIAGHIDILNDRLNKRGYSMNASFIKKGDGESDNVMEEILKQDKNISILSGYSFDARA